MKKFVFSLTKVLRFKEQNLDVLKNEMLQLQSRLLVIEEKIRQLNRELVTRSEQLQEESRTGISAQKLMSCQYYLHSLIQKISEATADRIACEKQIEQKKEELVQLKGEISGLERLEEKQRDDYRKAEAKAQELSVEEFVRQTCVAVR